MARIRPQIPEFATPAALAEMAPNKLAAPVRGQMGRGVYESIRSAVLECKFLPGMALSEQAVSDEMQVSRAPVREAFRQLVVEGLLEAIPQRGTFVSQLSRARIADAIFVREVIECRAAELAASAPLAERKKLKDLLKLQGAASAKKDYSTHLSVDEQFHHQILVLAGHPHAWGPLRLARTGMNRVRHLAIPAVGSHNIAIDQHRTIVDAIVEGNGPSAAEAMRLHIRSPLTFVDAIERQFPRYFEVTAVVSRSRT